MPCSSSSLKGLCFHPLVTDFIFRHAWTQNKVFSNTCFSHFKARILNNENSNYSGRTHLFIISIHFTISWCLTGHGSGPLFTWLPIELPLQGHRHGKQGHLRQALVVQRVTAAGKNKEHVRHQTQDPLRARRDVTTADRRETKIKRADSKKVKATRSHKGKKIRSQSAEPSRCLVNGSDKKGKRRRHHFKCLGATGHHRQRSNHATQD